MQFYSAFVFLETMDLPFFSVVIPAYNVEAYIEETVNSVLSQTLEDWELIIVNDGSTDHTLEKLESFRDERVRLITVPNAGVSRARNLGIERAAGQYIAFLDGDDVWHCSHLETAYRYLSSHPDSSWYSSVSIDGTRASQLTSPAECRVHEVLYFSRPSLYVNSSTVIIKAECAKAMLPLFPEGMRNAEDWAAWSVFAESHPTIAFADTRDVLYRQRSGSATTEKNADFYSSVYFALPNYWQEQLKGHSPDGMKQCYYRYRTTQRWQIRVSKMRIANWLAILGQHRHMLGTLRYTVLLVMVAMLHVLVLGLGKILYILSLSDEKKLRAGMSQN